VILGFLLEIAEKCALQGYYAAGSGNFLPKFRDKLSVPFSVLKKTPFLKPEKETDRFSRNVGKKFPLLAL